MSGPRRPARYVVWLMSTAAALIAFTVGSGVLRSDEDPIGPEGPPPVSENFPTADRQYLPHVTVAQLESWSELNDYRCEAEAPLRTRSGAEHRGRCRAPSEHLVAANVEYEFDQTTEVSWVRATCSSDTPGSDEYCADLFSLTAEEVYADQPTVRDEAVAWVADHLDRAKRTVLGGVEMQARPGEYAVWFLPES